jgi:hypothetical protein
MRINFALPPSDCADPDLILVVNMPVTIKPSPERMGRNIDQAVRNGQELFKKTPAACAPSGGRRILHSSFSDIENSTHGVLPYGNGFVNGVIRAFEQDLHLILRPDDIWLAILTQYVFS